LVNHFDKLQTHLHLWQRRDAQNLTNLWDQSEDPVHKTLNAKQPIKSAANQLILQKAALTESRKLFSPLQNFRLI